MNTKKMVYLVCGFLGLMLGLLGSVLPILPTVPFLLLAAYCFGRSSERLHRWFIGTRLYKKNLESFVQGKGMTFSAKLRITTTVTFLMLFGFLMMKNIPVGQIVLSVVWIAHLIYFLFGVKTYQPEAMTE